MRKYILSFLLIAISFSAAAQSKQEQSVDQVNTDVQVLQAWVGSGIDYANIDFEHCKVVATSVDRKTLDCSSLLSKLAANELTSPPLMAPFLVELGLESNGTAHLLNHSCKLIEVRTVTRLSALASPSFRGIGFYSWASANYFVPKESLEVVGQVRLSDNEPAVVHRFIAGAYCWRGSITSSTYQYLPFKPFAEYGSDDMIAYRQWENFSKDHYLGGDLYGNTGVVPRLSLDRQSEILKR